MIINVTKFFKLTLNSSDINHIARNGRTKGDMFTHSLTLKISARRVENGPSDTLARLTSQHCASIYFGKFILI